MQNWISIDDMLPNIKQSVLVYMSDKCFQEVPYMITQYDKYGFNVSNVTHWMPLPPPPVNSVNYDEFDGCAL